MNKVIFILVLFSASYQSLAQVVVSPRERINDKLYNKKTNEKIPEAEMVKIIQTYPTIVFEKIFNKYGEVEKFLFDPDNIKTGRSFSRSEEKQIQPGEKFPEFVFKTIDQKSIESEALLGKWVILRFELFAKLINQNDYNEQSNQLRQLNANENIVAIICFSDSYENITAVWNPSETLYQLVHNGYNFHEMFNIVSIPTTILINPEGKIHRYYFQGEKIEWNKLLKN